MKKLLSKISVAGFIVMFITVPLSFSAQAAEPCGMWSEDTREGKESPRFRILKEFDGKAFLDMETCLVWSLNVYTQPVTLTEAVTRCAHEGQGGPYGSMGWRLPSMAELTSLDGKQWREQRETFEKFEKYKLPPLVRMETPFRTTTPWPDESKPWTVVMFSARTTIVYPISKDESAAVWCVRCCPATGLR